MRKAGRIMLTFIDERRQRIRKAWEEGYAEGFKEGRVKALAEITDALLRNPRINAIIRNDPEIRKSLRNLGVELPD